ncbi:MAG TPA: hypothetical protein PKM27_03690 [Saprospiraceae bacterium]|nr:hypothetical protein [Saprospiraceae bacterium]HNT20706.1 hypothetical protein [Saprospiraceae bacterium]
MKPSTPYPLPDAFLKRMQDQLGTSYSSFLDAVEKISPPAVRLHPLKLAGHYEFPLDLNIPWEDHGYYLRERIKFTLDPSFHGGAYYVQEPSSMLVGPLVKRLLESYDQPLVLDLCASPGGKSTAILSALNGRGLLLANETIAGRISGLQHNLIKWGYANALISQSDPIQFQAFPGMFDLILVDAPCSGEGLFRKDHSSRKEWTPDLALQCSLRQKRILRDILPALKPGGILLYSTCTFNPAENMEQLHMLGGLGFESIPLKEWDDFPLVRLEENGVTGYQAYPHLMNGEGFFVGALRKGTGSQGPVPTTAPTGVEWVNPPRESQRFIPSGSGLKCFLHRDQYFVFPSAMADALDQFIGRLRLVQAGTALGQLKNKDFVPAHGWAQSLDCPGTVISLNVEKAEALQYLRKDPLPRQGLDPGYHLIRYEGISLGWIKSLPGRINNLYPMAYRIMQAG